MKAAQWPKSWFWLVLLLVYFGLPAVFERDLVRDIPPPIAAADLDGRGFDRSNAAERPTLLYFWGVWCPICSAMQRSINSVAEDHDVVTVALRSGTDSELRRHVREQGFSARVIPDPDGSIAERYGVRGVPALFFIDRNGRIRLTATGYTTEIGIRIRLWLTEQLG